MTPMSQVRRRHGLVWPLIVAMLGAFACSRPTGIPTDGATQASQAPFQTDGADPADASLTTRGTSEKGLPFHDSLTLPAGTLVTVRLGRSITAGNSISENGFAATLDEPIVVDGNTLISAGTAAAGRIESARVSKVGPHRAYVRLSLESIHLGGLDVPIQTASLFARPTPHSDDLIGLEKGRRLTFRLTEPVFLAAPHAAQVGH